MINTNADLLAAINRVLDYNWKDEEEDYNRQKEEGNDVDGHIYITLCELDEWVSE